MTTTSAPAKKTTKGLYVASPLGFSEAGRSFLPRISAAIEQAGFHTIDPWTLTPNDLVDAAAKMPISAERVAAYEKFNRIVGANNIKGIDESVGIIAVLDGTDVDSGTSSEIGYGAGQGKPILGYRGDFRKSSDNEGSICNLQVETFIFLNGGKIITTIDDMQQAITDVFGSGK